jgi:signal transduction histidine kinase
VILQIRSLAGPVTVVASLMSIALTAGIRSAGSRLSESDGWWNLAELFLLLALTALSARLSRPRWAVAACCGAGTAVALWLLRFGPAEGSWFLLVLVAGVAAGVGGYLRAVDARRARAVVGARRAQRLDLARDLHDYVAHDISEMVALAQAGQVLAGDGDAAVRDLFARVERAGIAGLESMDRTVRMLHEQPAPAPAPALTDLPELAERFRAAGAAPVHLDVAPGVPRDLGPTIYRIVSEAFTNVRRHARTATRVEVRVRDEGEHITVRVADDGTDRPAAPSRRGGFGLGGLTARVDALGGALVAGPADPHGWAVTATLPRKARP